MELKSHQQPGVSVSGTHVLSVVLPDLANALAFLISNNRETLDCSTRTMLVGLERQTLGTFQGFAIASYQGIGDQDKIEDMYLKIQWLASAIRAQLTPDDFESARKAQNPPLFGFSRITGSSP